MDSPRFPPDQRALLGSLPGVGEGLIGRLERCGINGMAQLAQTDTTALTERLALANCSHCWQSSPKAQQRIAAVIALARQYGNTARQTDNKTTAQAVPDFDD